jgi:protein involved in polysaccharide export with SLBB domain
VKRETGKQAREILAYLGLMVLLPLLGCSAGASQNIENPALLPPSQSITETRITAPYILDVGDEVKILVWGFDDLKQTTVVDNSGEIIIPMLGPVKVAGQSVPKTREMIAAGLKKYIVNPQVDVSTVGAARSQILVFGEVTTPGIITFKRPLMLVEAIAKAGWFNRDANTRTVLLVRRAEGKNYVSSINFAQIFQHGVKTNDFYLQSGDLVYVSPKGIVKLERFLQHINTIAQPFLTIEQAVVLWPQFFDVISGKTITGSPGLSIGTSNTTSSSSTK